MGEIVGAAVVSHVPPIVLPEGVRRELNDGEEISLVPGLHRLRSECLDRLRRALGRGARLRRDPLECAHNHEVLVRVLGNLKNAYIQSRDFVRALGACDRILLLTPDAPQEPRDRGLVYQQLECFSSSQVDLERFLEAAQPQIGHWLRSCPRAGQCSRPK